MSLNHLEEAGTFDYGHLDCLGQSAGEMSSWKLDQERLGVVKTCSGRKVASDQTLTALEVDTNFGPHSGIDLIMISESALLNSDGMASLETLLSSIQSQDMSQSSESGSKEEL